MMTATLSVIAAERFVETLLKHWDKGGAEGSTGPINL